MKIFSKILAIVIIGLLVLILITALFVKKEYSVGREISIAKPKQVVFDYVKYLKNQDNFSVWARIDPDMKKDYRGIDGTSGFVAAWDSKNKKAGKGEQEIIKISGSDRIDYVIRFLKPMKSTDNAFLSFNAVNDSITNVKWGIFGKINYPMNLMLLFMNMDAMLGKDLENGLKNLQTLMEK
jgi:hypothetical protein